MIFFTNQLNPKGLDKFNSNYLILLTESFRFCYQIRRHIFYWVLFLAVSCPEYVVEQAPVQSVVTVSIMMMLNMVIEV